MKRIIRVFPRKTKATPIDEHVRINTTPDLFDNYADEVHISVTFTWDIKRAEYLYKAWNSFMPNRVKVSGPAFGLPGEDFEPGMYLKKGYVITSRGCSNRCWFCSVWRREGLIKELPIKDGWIITDDNLLSCSENHIQAVFEMLKKQPYKPEFTGGLEAKLLTQERANQLKQLKPESMFFAYDTPDDLDPLIEAGKMLTAAGFSKNSHRLRAYVLIGYPKDTIESAIKRIKQTWNAGFMPMAMLWRNDTGEYTIEWKKFQRQWANPIITAANIKKYF
jgi:hypothetical protein